VTVIANLPACSIPSVGACRYAEDGSLELHEILHD